MKKTSVILKTTFIIFSLIAFILLPLGVMAQSSSGYALSIPLTEAVEEGDIVCSASGGYRKCEQAYETSLFGVVVSDPSIAIEDSELESSALVVSSGVAEVKVTSVNGSISEGDLITTSDIPGVGQLADSNGFVLGTAMENYSIESSENIGKIQVVINIHPSSGFKGRGSNLIQFIREGISVPVFDPLDSFRYILAVIMVILSFTLGMIYFGRTSRAGIEAVGRNPLAKKVIQMTVIMNVVLTIVIVLVGLAIAYLILIL